MREDDKPPEEKPRYLLPDGCKDLIDALHLQRQPPNSGPAAAPGDPPPMPIPFSPPGGLPKSISIPDPVILRDLATTLHTKSHVIIHALMYQNVFATAQTEIDFPTAAALCSRLGVVAHKVI